MNIVGLDVGFARNRPTSGVAHFGNAKLTVDHATADWADRRRALGSVCDADVAAIDAPVVPDIEHGQRAVERLLSGGLFQRRCKPGASHVQGTGSELRRAGRDTAGQLAHITSDRRLSRQFPRVWETRNIVEAFPNAFLGVCVEDTVYQEAPKLRRGKKFDWLYNEWVKIDLFSKLGALLGLDDSVVADTCKKNAHHEERAALVCLFTAASVASGTYVAVGEDVGGYIFLPPWGIWSRWAQEEVERQRQRHPAVKVWIDGVSFASTEALPNVSASQ